MQTGEDPETMGEALSRMTILLFLAVRLGDQSLVGVPGRVVRILDIAQSAPVAGAALESGAERQLQYAIALLHAALRSTAAPVKGCER